MDFGPAERLTSRIHTEQVAGGTGGNRDPVTAGGGAR